MSAKMWLKESSGKVRSGASSLVEKGVTQGERGPGGKNRSTMRGFGLVGKREQGKRSHELWPAVKERQIMRNGVQIEFRLTLRILDEKKPEI